MNPWDECEYWLRVQTNNAMGMLAAEPPYTVGRYNRAASIRKMVSELRSLATIGEGYLGERVRVRRHTRRRVLRDAVQGARLAAEQLEAVARLLADDVVCVGEDVADYQPPGGMP